MNNQHQNWTAPPTAPSRLPSTESSNARTYARDNSTSSSISYAPTPTTTTQRSAPVSRTSSATRGNEGIIVASRAGDEETEDGRIRNREAATKIRDAWIYKQIMARQVSASGVCDHQMFLNIGGRPIWSSVANIITT